MCREIFETAAADLAIMRNAVELLVFLKWHLVFVIDRKLSFVSSSHRSGQDGSDPGYEESFE